jgi:ADP-ribose pyrophosphatase
MPTVPRWAHQRHHRPRRVIIDAQERILDDIFKVDRAVVRYEQWDGTLSAPQVRLVFERGDSVGVLPYDKARRQVVLIRQFRYPVHVRDPQHAWLWEAIAGVQDADETPESVARREALEEAGYALDTLIHVATVYPSPGGTSERMHLYLAPISSAMRQDTGGGVDPGEDIAVVAWDLDHALDAMRRGEIVDAKTVLLLQHLPLHWSELPDK